MKNLEDIEIKKVIAGIGKNLDNKSWKCMASGCNEKAINSHLLQRHGVLSNIVENGHCYEVRERDVFSWSKDTPPLEFKRCGIQNAFSLHLFCNYHDTDLFKPIESGAVDYGLYFNQLLLSYRSICAEIRKKEVVLERYKRYLRSNVLQTYRGEHMIILRDVIKGSEAGLKDLEFYKKLIEKELDTPSDSFYFVHHTYPIKGLYASSSFTISNYEESINMVEVLPNCIGHIIPNGDCSELVFGYHKDYVNDAIVEFVNGWADLDAESLGQKLTGWFTLIEGWGISPSLYKKIKPEDLDRYLLLFGESSFDVDQDPNVGFNMFKGLL